MMKKFQINERVRWRDCDPTGIILYAAYFRFFEIGEVELFRAAGIPQYRLSEEHNLWFPRVSTHADFYKPALLDDELEIAVKVGKLGGASFRLEYEIRKRGEDTLLAEGYTVIATVNKQTFKAVRMPEEIREGLRGYLDT
jgi:acyl-CoA thioester hydrolase